MNPKELAATRALADRISNRPPADHSRRLRRYAEGQRPHDEASATAALRRRLEKQHKIPNPTRFDTDELASLGRATATVVTARRDAGLTDRQREIAIAEVVRVDGVDCPLLLAKPSDFYIASLYRGAVGRERILRGDSK